MNVSVPLPHSKYSALSLSPVIIDDALEMTILLNDEETVKYLIGPPHPLSIERVKDYISSRPSVNGHCLAWAIRHNEKLIEILSSICKANENQKDIPTTIFIIEYIILLDEVFSNWQSHIFDVEMTTSLDNACEQTQDEYE
ncbi:unnamed protein product [Rotaria sp. Silwood1]|nr:unnamed protein product [Rotaria sp. Silwood1]CAF4972159.1 unnamed protein product [Rotaria sp. Silwood1]CAF5007335.1 unnamed protein product [Rotaria sp. Silwood1]